MPRTAPTARLRTSVVSAHAKSGPRRDESAVKRRPPVAGYPRLMSRRRPRQRPSWHMRRGFLVAFLVSALTASLVRWWLGLALIAALGAYYLLMRFAPWVFLIGGEPPGS